MLGVPYVPRLVTDLSLLAPVIVLQVGDTVHRSQITPFGEGARTGGISALTETLANRNLGASFLLESPCIYC